MAAARLAGGQPRRNEVFLLELRRMAGQKHALDDGWSRLRNRSPSSRRCFFLLLAHSIRKTNCAIIEWASMFVRPKVLMSDGPTHFKNGTLRRISKGLRIPHHFILRYTPWSNGGAEHIGKELLRSFRAIVSELRMRSQ